ncbi:MAG: hypothetical protein EXS35_15750 [Pedosphaera sp.]|nr:hypothetical protein [Pedosphaera sp.]
MKTLNRWMALAVVAGILTATTALAGECCTKAAKDTKAGKTCEKCLTGKCCKDAAKAVKDAKSCDKCAAKAKAGAKEEKKN